MTSPGSKHFATQASACGARVKPGCDALFCQIGSRECWSKIEIAIDFGWKWLGRTNRRLMTQLSLGFAIPICIFPFTTYLFGAGRR